MDMLGFVQDGQSTDRTHEGGNMGRMLNLLESVVTRARHLQDIGRTHDALSLLRRHANQPAQLSSTDAVLSAAEAITQIFADYWNHHNLKRASQSP